jgi:glycosyltransferase involved in cell wall biosynthesis
MRIGLNLLYLIPGVVGGTEVYARSLIGAMSAAAPEHDLVAYLNAEAGRDLPLPDGVERVDCRVRGTSRLGRYAHEQLRLPHRVRTDGIDVLHSLGYVGPLHSPCPHVVTVHDLVHVGHAGGMSRTKRLALGFFVEQTARRADRVITVSEASRAELVAELGIAAADVTVVHEAPPDRPVVDPARDEGVLHALGVERPYVLAFSSASPTKNIPRLIDAFVAADLPPSCRLLVVGRRPPDGSVERAAAAHPGRVLLTGFVPDEHVTIALRNATALAFPSTYEGFGLPILDAQHAGVPVACSTAGSLPEIAGGAAVLFDPASTADIAVALGRVVTDDATRAALVASGTRNAGRFSWSAAAAQTLDVYRAVIEQATGPS